MSTERLKAQIESVMPLTDSILQLILAPEHYLDYQAGQYLEIISGNHSLCYSIANAPLGAHKYELHIRHSLDNPSTQQLLAEIKKNGFVTIQLPLGSCSLDKLKPEKPIIFIAGGTGFAPIKAMIEQLLAVTDPRAFELFWGARSHSDLYMNDKVIQWQSHASQFRYFSLLSNSSEDTLAKIVLDQHPKDIKKWQFVISGPFDMAYATRDKLIAEGISADHLFSDAFHFEKK